MLDWLLLLLGVMLLRALVRHAFFGGRVGVERPDPDTRRAGWDQGHVVGYNLFVNHLPDGSVLLGVELVRRGRDQWGRWMEPDWEGADHDPGTWDWRTVRPPCWVWRVLCRDTQERRAAYARRVLARRFYKALAAQTRQERAIRATKTGQAAPVYQEERVRVDGDGRADLREVRQ